MLIGKAGIARTEMSTATADRIEVRGKDLCSDLMGNLSFTDYFFFLVCGRVPTEDQRYFLDVLLVSIAEHGLVPSVQAARMTYRADPNALQGAVAAGVLGCGSVILGTAELCGDVLAEAQKHVSEGTEPQEAALSVLRKLRASGKTAPGFGHPIHKPVDPRTERIFDLATQRGVAGPHVQLARHMERAVKEVWGRPMPMNASMAIAAVLLDLKFPAAIIKGVPILARTAGLLAHLAEESANPIGFLMAHHAEESIEYGSLKG